MIERKLINPISDDGLRGPVLVGELRSPLAEIWSDVAPKFQTIADRVSRACGIEALPLDDIYLSGLEYH